ncbi:MAG: flagellar assembly protein T N-terminal domain-containing protein [Deltaproteobacteria bacterium]|nr:flagellar assembly protein T N-terminal domain-containing protein [Deltaproteobacteria bacterium]
MRNFICFYLSIFCLSCISPQSSFAASEPFNASAEGVGVIVDGNTAIARDQAIQDALRLVVEQAAGTMVSSETLVQNYEVMRDQIYSKSQGYIQRYEVTDESTEGNLYKVTIQAAVAEGNLKNDIMALGLLMARKNMPRVMIMVAEQNIGMHYYSYWWGVKAGTADLSITENVLMEKLTRKGFHIVDYAVTSKTLEIKAPYKIESLNNDAVRSIGNLYDAEVVIYGKALSKLAGSVLGTSMKSAQADISLRVVSTDTGRVIASSTHHAAAVHPNEVTAGADALKLATDVIADQLIEQIVNQWSQDVSGGSLIRLVVSDIPSYRHLVKFKEMIQKRVRGVSGLYQRDFNAGTATLDVSVPATSQKLADELVVIDYGEFAIDVTNITQNSVSLKMK